MSVSTNFQNLVKAIKEGQDLPERIGHRTEDEQIELLIAAIMGKNLRYLEPFLRTFSITNERALPDLFNGIIDDLTDVQMAERKRLAEILIHSTYIGESQYVIEAQEYSLRQEG